MSIHRVFCKYCRGELTNKREIQKECHKDCEKLLMSNHNYLQNLVNIGFIVFKIDKIKDTYTITEFLEYNQQQIKKLFNIQGKSITHLLVDLLLKWPIVVDYDLSPEKKFCFLQNNKVKAIYYNHIEDEDFYFEKEHEDFGLQLSKLICKHTSITHIILDNIYFQIFPEFSNLKNLQYLDIYYWSTIESIENLKDLHKLKYLRLKTEFDVYKEIDDQILKKFWNNLTEMKNLVTVKLINSPTGDPYFFDITSNSPSIENLQLEFIKIRTDQSVNTSRLRHFTSLNFNIKKYNPSLKTLKYDYFFDNFNGFTDFFKNIHKIKINSDYSPNKKLDIEIAKLLIQDKLKKLSIDGDLDKDSYNVKLPVLKKLILKNSNFLDLKIDYFQLQNIESLIINNSLRETNNLKNVLHSLSNLTKLNIVEYGLIEPEIFSFSSSLKQLSLYFEVHKLSSAFTYLEKILQFLPHLKFELRFDMDYLLAQRENLQCGFLIKMNSSALSQIKTLHFDYGDVGKEETWFGIPEWIFECQNLKKLKLKSDKYTRRYFQFNYEDESFSKLKRLKILDLSKLIYLFDTLPDFHHVEVLHINPGQIIDLQFAIKQFPIKITRRDDWFHWFEVGSNRSNSLPNLKKVIIHGKYTPKIVLKMEDFHFLEVLGKFPWAKYYKIKKRNGGYYAKCYDDDFEIRELKRLVFKTKKKLIEYFTLDTEGEENYIAIYVYKKQVYGIVTYNFSLNEILKRTIFDFEDRKEKYQYYTFQDYKKLRLLKIKSKYEHTMVKEPVSHPQWINRGLPTINFRHLELSLDSYDLEEIFNYKNLKSLRLYIHSDLYRDSFLYYPEKVKKRLRKGFIKSVEHFLERLNEITDLKELSLEACECWNDYGFDRPIFEGFKKFNIDFVRLPRLKKLRIDIDFFAIGLNNDFPFLKKFDPISS